MGNSREIASDFMRPLCNTFSILVTKPLKRIRSLSAGLLLAKVQSVKTTPSSTRPKSATPGSGTTTVIQSTPSLHPLSTNVPATLTGRATKSLIVSKLCLLHTSVTCKSLPLENVH